MSLDTFLSDLIVDIHQEEKEEKTVKSVRQLPHVRIVPDRAVMPHYSTCVSRHSKLLRRVIEGGAIILETTIGGSPIICEHSSIDEHNTKSNMELCNSVDRKQRRFWSMVPPEVAKASATTTMTTIDQSMWNSDSLLFFPHSRSSSTRASYPSCTSSTSPSQLYTSIPNDSGGTCNKYLKGSMEPTTKAIRRIDRWSRQNSDSSLLALKPPKRNNAMPVSRSVLMTLHQQKKQLQPFGSNV